MGDKKRLCVAFSMSFKYIYAMPASYKSDVLALEYFILRNRVTVALVCIYTIYKISDSEWTGTQPNGKTKRKKIQELRARGRTHKADKEQFKYCGSVIKLKCINK